MVVTLCLPHIVVELDMGMVTKQMTYVRTMKVSYDNSDNLGNNIREINTRLHEEGIATMDRYDDYDKDRYGLFDSVSKSRNYHMSVDGEIVYESEYRILSQGALEQLNSALLEKFGVLVTKITCGVNTTETSETIHHRLNGNHLVTLESINQTSPTEKFQYGLEPSMLITGESGIGTYSSNLMVKFDEGSSFGIRPPSITFTTTILSEGVLRKADIERGVVDSTLETIGKIQAVFEKVLMSFNYDLSEPTIDCHFDAKSESRSECTPDIIERTRAEKERQLERAMDNQGTFKLTRNEL